MDAAAWEERSSWFRRSLDELDSDSRVRGILVFLHHPPFTNSEVVDPDGDVRAAFLGPFQDAKKTMAMVTGHAHGYEHFPAGGREEAR